MEEAIRRVGTYTFRVSWDAEEQLFVGRCLEFRDLTFVAPVESDAREGVRQLTLDTVLDKLAEGEFLPPPFQE